MTSLRPRLHLTWLWLALAVPPLARAHHSFTMFFPDVAKPLEGTVKTFQDTNPHSWLDLLVTDSATGNTTVWSIEGPPPSWLTNDGINKDSLKPGDKVSVMYRPLRSGLPGGYLAAIQFPDGHTVSLALRGNGNNTGAGQAQPPAASPSAPAPAAAP